MKILVIIVTYNGMRWIDRCLGSALSSLTPVDVLVIDNMSTDGTAQHVAEHYPNVELLRNDSNTGFAEANNKGFRRAVEEGYDYVYLLNQDAWIFPDTIGHLVEVQRAHPGFAILSPEQMQGDGVSYNPVFAKEVIPSEKSVDESMNLYEVPFVMAAHWFMPVDALREVGFFATMFPIYGNDDNYCHRVLYHNRKIGVVRGLRVIHDKTQSKPSFEAVVYRNYYTSALVALADIRKPLAMNICHVLALTAVKCMRYKSLAPLRYLPRIFGKDMGKVRSLRQSSSQRPNT